ncbi:Reverse transcriptase (RNA-dependent DNA polymerase) [Popillia japonica]|uniref:Reverse transcriptase (RNA-dependent DNA polymerase) n=1 Tax=Popillia japonica TaxID=7064 RepID=A0AAW1N873_POPJA
MRKLILTKKDNCSSVEEYISTVINVDLIFPDEQQLEQGPAEVGVDDKEDADEETDSTIKEESSDTETNSTDGVYVDDLIFVSNDKHVMNKAKEYLQQEFKMKDMGEIKNCLGFRITGDRQHGKLWIDQEEYLRQVLDRFQFL